MIMAVAALLKDKPKPTDADINSTIPTFVAAAPSSRCVKRFTPQPTRKGEAAMKHIQIDRRSFVVGAAAVGGGLTLGLQIPLRGPKVVRAQDGSPEITAWIVNPAR